MTGAARWLVASGMLAFLLAGCPALAREVSDLEAGRRLFEASAMEPAARAFQRGLGAQPRNAELHAWLGRTYLEMKRYGEALPPLRQAADLEPESAVYHHLLGLAYYLRAEYEPAKAKIARQNFEEAGLSEFIELREGDLRETLKDVGGPVDFMLVDIWQVAAPALERVSPSLRPGAIVACDNTISAANEYGAYFEFVNDPKNRFRTMTVPFEGGFELTVRI